MKLPANSFYGNQIMDRSRYTVTKYFSDEKTHAAISSKLFRKLDHVNNALYEIELVKAQFEHRESIIVEFFNLQYAKLQMLELYYSFFTKICDVNKFEEWETDTDHCFLMLLRKDWKTLYDLERKQSGSNCCHQKYVAVVLLLNHLESFFLGCAVTSIKNMSSESLILSKRNSVVRE